MQILWRDPRLNTSPRHAAQNSILCTQRMKPAQQRKNHFSPSCHHLKTKTTRVTLGKEHPQTGPTAVGCRAPELQCRSESSASQPKPASYTHSWTRNCFISTLQPQQGMFSTGSPFQWSLSDSQGEQLHSWRGRDSRALPQETLASRVFTHPASTEYTDKTHWFKTMLEHIIYLRSELLNRVFCWKQTHFLKN